MKVKYFDYFTKEEERLLRVLETSIINAKTIREIKEAKSCVGDLMIKVLKRAKKDM